MNTQVDKDDILLALPIDITCRILSQWLESRDVLSIDKAYCNLAKRNIWLGAVIQSPQCQLQYKGRFRDEVEYLFCE